MATYTRWSKMERMTRSWKEMADAQLIDEALSIIAVRLGITDTNATKYLMSCGVELIRAEDAVFYARKALKEQGFNRSPLQRSVGSDSYVDGQTKRSTI